MNRTIQIVGSSVALAVACAASAQNITGPSSSATPYVLPTPGSKVTKVVSLLTVGDSVNNDAAGNPYRLIGIPDGMGAYANGDGTYQVTVSVSDGELTSNTISLGLDILDTVEEVDATGHFDRFESRGQLHCCFIAGALRQHRLGDVGFML